MGGLRGGCVRVVECYVHPGEYPMGLSGGTSVIPLGMMSP